MKKIRIIIVYDNNAKEGLKSNLGFSCLIETAESNILFDTGTSPEILFYNMKKLDINPKEIDTIVISHNHWDHTGGLKGFLKENENKARIIKPTDFVDYTKITKKVYSTGYLKSLIGIKEQSLVVETKKGLIVIVGCSHPGVDKILERVRKNGRVYAIMGGFHDSNNLNSLKGINIIGACHCTEHKKEIKEKFPKNFKNVKAGYILEIE